MPRGPGGRRPCSFITPFFFCTPLRLRSVSAWPLLRWCVLCRGVGSPSGVRVQEAPGATSSVALPEKPTEA
ncbi:hypothetical protein BREVNS_1446 [Brevinematales bacterium NS]|nr:hypothetical protein BREVNS_1446 [Brevinematales bacterium NS]